MPEQLLGERTWAGSRKGLVGRPFQRIANVTGSDAVVAPANPHRRAIIFSNNDPASLIFIAINIAAVANQGQLLVPGGPPLIFWEYDLGKMNEAEFHAIATLKAPTAGASKTNSVIGAQVSTAAAADLITFTVPAGQIGILRAATISNFVGGAPTVALQLVRGASTITLTSVTAQTFLTPNLELQAADVIKWRCTTGVAATTVDVTLSVDTYTDTGSAPTSAPLGIWELED